ncbi:hypothetical protein [Deinococcus sp. UR1]|uniref:hypothetical protein n=1 Tax=Deinococcus sp. UR1 TaxID=1704277 RepID=UPI0006DC054B|nr:hypothetical protein [Deinococcus sp. UR1]PIG98304.1 hypothetical protein AMD26_009210 [Deinococcus sp. UR1]
MSLPHLHAALNRTDWAALAEQKGALAEHVAAARLAHAGLAAEGHDSAADLALDHAHDLDGILHWMDALMDAAQQDGFPVVFLTTTE